MSGEAVSSLQTGIYLFPEFVPDAVAAFSNREFDASKNLSLFLQSLGSDPRHFATVKQVHGDRVVLATVPTGAENGQAVEADGLITNQKDLALVIRTADCVPVFFFDPQTPAVGICHAGWRGIKKGIMLRMLEKFQRIFNAQAETLRVAIGPSIRSSCYEVGEEFGDYFSGFVKQRDQKYFCDLPGFVQNQLLEAGVPEEAITDSGFCTACSVDQFFSARREGPETGRLISVIILK